MDQTVPPIWTQMKMSEAQYRELVKSSEDKKKNNLKSTMARKMLKGLFPNYGK